VSALSSVVSGFCAALVENIREKPWASVNRCTAGASVGAPAGSRPFVWLQGSRVSTALFELFFLFLILCSLTKIYCP